MHAAARVAALALGVGLVGLVGCAARLGGHTSAELGHPLVGRAAPLFARPRVAGGAPFELARARGQVVVVVFWATWCQPCRKAFPQLQKLSEKYAGTVTIVGVSEDDEPSGIDEFLAIHDGKFDNVWDDGKRIAGKWEPRKPPASFVVDASGTVRFVHLGYDDGEDAEIEKELKTLL